MNRDTERIAIELVREDSSGNVFIGSKIGKGRKWRYSREDVGQD